MDRDQLVETIIKEVRRVLAEKGVPIAPASGATSAPVSTSEVNKPQALRVGTTQPVISGTDYIVGTRDLSGKQVITQKDLEGLKGASIQVTLNAVITPLARDYAREKGISITRIEQKAATVDNRVSVPGTVTVALVFAPDFPGDPKIVNSILNSKGFQIRDLSGQQYEEAVKKLAAAVASGSAHFGVCIEKTGMEGPIHANRNSKIRAVHCRGTFDARAARVDYNANVIVIDSTSDPDAVISGFCGM